MMNETIMEVREDFMLSPAGDSEPTLRTAHFLKPIATEANTTHEILSSSSIFEPKEWPLKIHFHGWRHPLKKWVEWVDSLKQTYESVWKKVGIFEAIMSSKCHIPKNKDLLFGVVQKWCCETNTFVFPWGEATITLEDVMVLGGYPVLGDPVFTKLQTQEMREVEEKLILATMQTWKSKNVWIDMFKDNKGSEIEHEAFLATWLSFYVFPHNGLIKTSLFPIAIHLARGNPIALAPPVLATIYSDLGLFKKTIVGFTKNSVLGPLEVTLKSPLVQIWVWERFINLQPAPKLINSGDPLLFKWHNVKALKFDNVRLAVALNSAVDDFLRRPYVRYADNCNLFYPKDEIWVPFKSNLDTELLTFVTCLRVSELVGIDFIEQYLPHRVAMQFGMDQDVPGCVHRFNETKAIAWENYCRPISDRNLYFPSRFFEAGVTTGYAKWWKQSVLGHQGFDKNIEQRKRSSSSPNRSGNDAAADVPQGFPLKLVDIVVFGKSYDDCSNTRKGDINDDADDVSSDFILKLQNLKIVPSENSVQVCRKTDESIDAADETLCQPTALEEYKCDVIIHEREHFSNQCSSADYDNMLPLKKLVAKDNTEVSIGGSEEGFKDSNGIKESRLEGVMEVELEERISKLEGVIKELKMKRFGHS